MKPWERRLKDLSLLLSSCHRTYFSPEQFRLNLNQFLQTSRTVTFILQKNKAEIPDFDTWYGRYVEKWKNSMLMEWAKESRNSIEKIGDLELHSSMIVSLVTSYLDETDRILKFEDAGLLSFGVGKIYKLAREEYSYLDRQEWAIKIERQWKANDLPDLELLAAMNILYSNQFEVCSEACSLVGLEISKEVPSPSEIATMTSSSRHVQYIDGHTGRLRVAAQVKMKPFDFGLFGKSIALLQKKRFESITSFDSGFEIMVESAKEHFLRDKFHISILFCFSSVGRLIDAIPIEFETRAEKFVLFREIAEQVGFLRASFVIFVAETWLRQQPESLGTPFSVSALAIKGEALQIVGAQASGPIRAVHLPILREAEGKVSLGKPVISTSEAKNTAFNFLVPMMRAMERNANA